MPPSWDILVAVVSLAQLIDCRTVVLEIHIELITALVVEHKVPFDTSIFWTDSFVVHHKIVAVLLDNPNQRIRI